MNEQRPDPGTSAVWTLPQRRALLVICSAVLAYLAVRAAAHRAHVPDPQPPTGDRAHEVADRIDPNTASVATLAALPGLGMKRAQDVADYRARFTLTGLDRPPFVTPDDLANVPGIGPSMVRTLTPYLVFPATQPVQPPAPTTRGDSF